VVEDLHKLRAEVDFDAGEEDGLGLAFEVVVVEEGQFARPDVDFYQVGFPGVTEANGTALDVGTQDGREAVQEAAVEGKLHLVAVEDAEVELLDSEFDFAGIAGGEEDIAGEILGPVQVAEEGLDVVFDSKRDLAAEELFPKVRHGEINESVFFAGLPGQLKKMVAMLFDNKGHGTLEAAAHAADLGELVELAGFRSAAEFQQALPEGVEKVPVEVVAIHYTAFTPGG